MTLAPLFLERRRQLAGQLGRAGLDALLCSSPITRASLKAGTSAS
jgi:hypothetical protein